MVLKQMDDGRGNTTTTQTDLVGRTIAQTDAAGNTTTTEYSPDCDQPAKVTDALGNTTCYTYDAIGRPTLRHTQRANRAQDDSFAYNNRSELVAATLGAKGYAYTYDNIGNRENAQEYAEEVTKYTANELNQYTAVGDFMPEFDPAGNQTLVKTSTGIWRVTYNAENRAEQFVCIDRDTVVKCTYDTMGRRATKKVTTNGTVTLHQRYIYRGYLQIAACDLTRTNTPALWHLLWDPTQPVATRPLAIQKDGTWYTYGWDLTKNICEVYGPNGNIRTAYTYAPYGSVTADSDVTQPIQWSSEFSDSDLGLIYYNYRYYNPTDGRWTRRDPIGIRGGVNLYGYLLNNAVSISDALGKNPCTKCEEKIASKKVDYATLIQELEENRCVLNFSCADRRGKSAGATWRSDSRWWFASPITIEIQFDCCYMTKSNGEDVFGHELVHARDFCFNRTPNKDCKSSVCSEMRAYYASSCYWKSGESLRQCLKDRVKKSSRSICTNETEILNNLDEFFDKGECLDSWGL